MAANNNTPKTKKKQKPQTLTEKQENFAIEYVMNGRNASAAYREVYDVKEDAKPAGVWVAASNLLNSDKVSVRVHQLLMRDIGSKVMTIDERKELLSKQAQQGCTKSMDMLNKMDGSYEKDNLQQQERIVVNMQL